MAGVPITIQNAIIVSNDDGTCTISGLASITGLSVGGGPMPGGPGQPPSIWPSPGRPTHPIWGPPGFNPPGPGMPPGIWHDPIIGGGGGGKPPGQPTFPIWGPPGMELPPGSGYPPVAGHPLPPEGGGEPPKPLDNWEAKIGWSAEQGWFVALVPTGDQNIPTPSK